MLLEIGLLDGGAARRVLTLAGRPFNEEAATSIEHAQAVLNEDLAKPNGLVEGDNASKG